MKTNQIGICLTYIGTLKLTFALFTDECPKISNAYLYFFIFFFFTSYTIIHIIILYIQYETIRYKHFHIFSIISFTQHCTIPYLVIDLNKFDTFSC